LEEEQRLLDLEEEQRLLDLEQLELKEGLEQEKEIPLEEDNLAGKAFYPGIGEASTVDFTPIWNWIINLFGG